MLWLAPLGPPRSGSTVILTLPWHRSDTSHPNTLTSVPSGRGGGGGWGRSRRYLRPRSRSKPRGLGGGEGSKVRCGPATKLHSRPSSPSQFHMCSCLSASPIQFPGWGGGGGGGLHTRPPCVTFRRAVAPLRGPGRSPVLPFACCVGSLLSVGRCGRCSCWCRFRVRGAQ